MTKWYIGELTILLFPFLFALLFFCQLVDMAGLDLVVSVNVSVYTVQCVTLFMVTATAVLYKATVEHTVSMVSAWLRMCGSTAAMYGCLWDMA